MTDPDIARGLIFVLRQHLKDEHLIAQAATPGPWRYNPLKEWHDDRTGEAEEFIAAGPAHEPICVAATGPSGDTESARDALHIAHHHPQRTQARNSALDVLLRAVAENENLLNNRSVLAALTAWTSAYTEID